MDGAQHSTMLGKNMDMVLPEGLNYPADRLQGAALIGRRTVRMVPSQQGPFSGDDGNSQIQFNIGSQGTAMADYKTLKLRFRWTPYVPAPPAPATAVMGQPLNWTILNDGATSIIRELIWSVGGVTTDDIRYYNLIMNWLVYYTSSYNWIITQGIVCGYYLDWLAHSAMSIASDLGQTISYAAHPSYATAAGGNGQRQFFSNLDYPPAFVNAGVGATGGVNNYGISTQSSAAPGPIGGSGIASGGIGTAQNTPVMAPGLMVASNLGFDYVDPATGGGSAAIARDAAELSLIGENYNQAYATGGASAVPEPMALGFRSPGIAGACSYYKPLGGFMWNPDLTTKPTTSPWGWFTYVAAGNPLTVQNDVIPGDGRLSAYPGYRGGGASGAANKFDPSLYVQTSDIMAGLYAIPGGGDPLGIYTQIWARANQAGGYTTPGQQMYFEVPLSLTSWCRSSRLAPSPIMQNNQLTLLLETWARSHVCNARFDNNTGAAGGIPIATQYQGYGYRIDQVSLLCDYVTPHPAYARAIAEMAASPTGLSISLDTFLCQPIVQTIGTQAVIPFTVAKSKVNGIYCIPRFVDDIANPLVQSLSHYAFADLQWYQWTIGGVTYPNWLAGYSSDPYGTGVGGNSVGHTVWSTGLSEMYALAMDSLVQWNSQEAKGVVPFPNYGGCFARNALLLPPRFFVGVDLEVTPGLHTGLDTKTTNPTMFLTMQYYKTPDSGGPNAQSMEFAIITHFQQMVTWEGNVLQVFD